MELKTLQIEIVLTEMIAERNKIILQLNEQAIQQQNQIKELESKIEALQPKE